MPDCFAFLVPYQEPEEYVEGERPQRVERIGSRYAVAYYCDRQELQSDRFFYSAIPRCFTTMQETVPEAMGVERLRTLPGLDLYGQGVLIGIVDTGIMYRDSAFYDRAGRVRITTIWDQTEEGENASVPFGKVYSREELQSGTPSTTDSIGHGTALAGIAAGSGGEEAEGIAPNAELVVVRLRNAPDNLKQYYRIETDAPCFSEADIMLGIQFLHEEAFRLGRPIVMLLALGSNAGGHNGSGYLEQYIGDLCRLRGRQVVIAAGNEANAGHHFEGTIELVEDREEEELPYEEVQLRVEQGESMTMELWCEAPNLLAIGIVSPGGEIVERVEPISDRYEARDFLLEGSSVVITYQRIGLHTADPLVLVRFRNMSEGIWTLRVYTEEAIGERIRYNCWMPVRAFLKGNAQFLRPSPDMTVTEPGNAPEGMTVTAYDPFVNRIDPSGGRGYTATNVVKPDLAAPYEVGAQSIFSTDAVSQGAEVLRQGTSLAAAAAAGANALLFEWAIVRGNRDYLTGTEATTYFVNGAERDDRRYPNREWGYGKLSIYGAIAENR